MLSYAPFYSNFGEIFLIAVPIKKRKFRKHKKLNKHAY